MKRNIKFLVLATSTAFGFGASIGWADHDYILIETFIENPDPFPGRKTSQKAIWKQGKHSHWTGTTDFTFWNGKVVKLQGSGKYHFEWDEEPDVVYMDGEAVSGFGVGPRINYKFVFTVGPENIRIRGCHDGYPSYRISVNGEKIYTHKHKSIDLIKLFGECDTQVNESYPYPNLH